MADISLYDFESPLKGYEGLEPLGNEVSKDGKSLINPAAKSASQAYNAFIDPIHTQDGAAGFDVHVYYDANKESELKFAHELHERVRREFPELRIYKPFDRPVGPHPTAMFEVNLFTPQQFGAFVPWLVVNRGPLSALVHPNTDDELRDHSYSATWVGEPVPLALGWLKQFLDSKPTRK